MSRVTNDVDTLNQLFSQGLTQLLGSLFSLIGIVVAMLFLDWNLALACFTIKPIMLLLTSFFARRARHAFRLTRETVGDVTAGVQEDIGRRYGMVLTDHKLTLLQATDRFVRANSVTTPKVLWAIE